MKRTFQNILLGSFVLCASNGYAVRANPHPLPLLQPDGTTIMTRIVGDEHFHYCVSEDNLPLEKGSDGYMYYAVADGDEALRPGSVRAADVSSRTLADKEWIKANIDLSVLDKVIDAKARKELAGSPRRSANRRASAYPTVGQQRGLVILVEYQDVFFTVPDANNEFHRMLNEPGYSNYGGVGSARDWFIDNSMGQFTPDFDVYGPVRLAHPRAYYGANKGGEDARAEFMVIEACEQLDDEVDFTVYDCDGDGFIDNVFIFFAGYGENLGMAAGADCVWPHSYDITEITQVPYTHDGVRLDHYACTNEIDLENRMDGIGTFCHEFSHVMGLPDLYATNYSTAFTPGEWSVMDGGPYNNDSRTPPYYSAFERYSLGWLTPREIGEPANVKLESIAANQACRITTENENEYFIFENRQQKGWDEYIPGHGMLVWHIDYNENIWRYNTVNDRQSHQYVDIEEADGTQHESSVDGDCFPGAAGITSFTDDTTPNMLSWDGKPQNKPITEIRESNGYIYFKISGGKTEVLPVETLDATDIHAEGFTAHWTEGDKNSEYRLSVYTMTENASGKPSINYADGYRDLNVGEVTSWKVEGLTPATEYRYTVRVVDNLSNVESVASNETIITTLPPEFRHLIPELEEVSVVGEDSFIARWLPVEGADTYLVSVYGKDYGESEEDVVDFTGGLSAMPEGWITSSRQTYGSASYSGQSAPSLRLNADGQYLESASYKNGVRGLSFWHRGAQSGVGSCLHLLGNNGVDWTELASIPIVNEAGGYLWNSADEIMTWRDDIIAIRLDAEIHEKGSIAIDDVVLSHGGDVTRLPVAGYTDYDTKGDTQICVEGLENGKRYWYSVCALRGEERSKTSREGVVTTGVNSVDMIGADVDFSINGLNVTIKGHPETAALYTPCGIIVAWGKVTPQGLLLNAPRGGIYLLHVGNKAYKLMLK